MKFVTTNIKNIFHLMSLILAGKKYEARREVIRKYGNILKRYYARNPSKGLSIIEEKWDNLIILDACRYDHFQKMNTLRGKLEKKVSRGSSTSDWLRKNFKNYYDDIVYISANPHCSDHEVDGFRGADHFYHVENVWKYGWDDSLDTVPPNQITTAALKMKEAYPDKRLIVHYIQPHGPWIGKTRISVAEIGFDPSLAHSTDKWVVDTMAWNLAEEGRFDIDLLWQATLDNLELVLGEVETLVNALSGQVVVTADHGESFSENWVYGHPTGIYTKELVEIPWLIIDKGPANRSIIKEGLWTNGKAKPKQVYQQEMPAEQKDKIEERLMALGYFE